MFLPVGYAVYRMGWPPCVWNEFGVADPATGSEPRNRVTAIVTSLFPFPWIGMFSLLLSFALGTPDLTSERADVRAQSLLSLEMDALMVARNGGDGNRWLSLGLAETGLDQLTLPVVSMVPGFPEELEFSDCTASTSVRCDELESWDSESDAPPTRYIECDGKATLTCTSSVAFVAEAAQDVMLRCGGVSVRGRAEVGQHLSLQLDGCVRSGRSPILEVVASVGSLEGLGLLSSLGAGDPFGDLTLNTFDTELNSMEFGATNNLSLDDVLSGAVGGAALSRDAVRGGVGIGGGGTGLGRIGSEYAPPRAGPRWTRAETVGSPFGPNGMKVAIAGTIVVGAVRERLLFFDLETGESQSEHALVVGTEGRRVNEVCARADGRYAAIVAGSTGLDTHGGGYEVWSLADAPVQIVSEERHRSAHSCAFAGEFVAIGTRQGIDVWELERSVLRRTLVGDSEYSGQLDTVRLLAGHPSEPVVAVQKNGAVYTVNLRSGDWTKIVDYPGFPLDTEWVEDDVLVFADTLDDSAELGTVLLGLSDGSTRQLVGDRMHVAAALGLLIVGTPTGSVALDPSTGDVLGAVFEGALPPRDVTVSVDGTWAVQTSSYGPATRVRIRP